MRATLKQIALACGVSATAVSAILRNRQGSVRYSPALQEKVQKTAATLNYQPDLLARSLVSGGVPIVAVCLHSDRLLPFNFYAFDNLQQAAAELGAGGYEMLFLPYPDHATQIRRLRRLIASRLISGVITNLIRDDCAALMTFLESANLPVILLGTLPGSTFPTLQIDSGMIWQQAAAYAASRGFKHLVSVQPEPQSLAVASVPTYRTANARGEGQPLRRPPFADRDTLFVCNADRFSQCLLREKRLPPERLLTVEDARMLPLSRPALLVESLHARRMTQAVKLLLEWIGSGRQPAARCTQIALQPDQIRLIE